MGRKQLSGAQKRKIAKAKALAGPTLMPRPPTAADLGSLTGVAREANRNYRDWKQGRMSHEVYLVAVRGLSALTTTYAAREAERQREIDEQIARQLEQHEARLAGVPLIESTPPAPGPALVGELMPRLDDAEVES